MYVYSVVLHTLQKELIPSVKKSYVCVCVCATICDHRILPGSHLAICSHSTVEGVVYSYGTLYTVEHVVI